MKLLVTGLNHKSAPVEARERIAFGEQMLPEALAALCSQSGVREGLILSTCNRVEIVVATDEETDVRLLFSFLARMQQVEEQWLEPYLYIYQDQAAVRHLFRVAASLDSMVVGEPQILGQMKAAFQAAKERGTLSGPLEEIVSRAFSVAKRVRAETEIGRSAVSVSYAAVELAREIFGSLNGHTVLLIGAGKMSELAARHLHGSGASRIFVANRTFERARELAETFQGTVVDYERLHPSLPDMDVVITSSGAPEYIIRKADMKRVLDSRKNRPVFLIDIAVPRNIDPAVNELDNVFLYDIDDLQEVVNENVAGRRKEAQQAEAIITEEVDRTMARLRTRQVAPTIVNLQDQLENIRLAEIARLRNRLGALTEQQEEAINALTRGIINKVAHGAISELRREAGQENGSHVANMIRRMFRLRE